jgi:hypothetical protein
VGWREGRAGGTSSNACTGLPAVARTRDGEAPPEPREPAAPQSSVGTPMSRAHAAAGDAPRAVASEFIVRTA